MQTLDQLPWAEQKKIAAWTACQPVEGFSPGVVRIDAHGHIIRWADYGKQTVYGWEIDHAHPTALGGTDTLDNLRALHWQRNRALGGHVGQALNEYREQNALKARGMFGFRRP